MNRIETCIPLKTAFEVAYTITSDTSNIQHVNINQETLENTASNLKDFISNNKSDKMWNMPNIPQMTSKLEDIHTWGNVPDWMTDELRKTVYLIMYELIASSVNYCYWYGADNIRPNNSRSSEMYKLLNESFSEYWEECKEDFGMEQIVDIFSSKLIENRFPLLKERVAHLNEFIIAHEPPYYTYKDKAFRITSRCHGEAFAIQLAKQIMTDDIGLDLRFWINKLLKWIPGFAEDIFLKRASLFFMMLYRRKRYFQDEISYLPIPADYQIPKVLYSLDVLKYDQYLLDKICNSEIITEGSLAECQIRASTIVVAENMARIAGCSSVDVDDYLWSLKDKVNSQFHLTKTTNY